VHSQVPCEWGCGEQVKVCEMRQHINQRCGLRIVNCELGCNDRLPQRDMEHHKA
jgi:hypothetical protein